MKSLKIFIKESNIEELKNKIISYLSDKKNQKFLRKEDLKKAYEVLQSLSDDEYNQLTEILYKGNKNGFKKLIEILEKETSCKKEFIKLLVQKNENNDFPSFNDLYNSNNLFNIMLNNTNIKNIFNNQNEFQYFLEKLITCKYKDENDKGVGQGELYIMTLFKNTSIASKGDILIDGKTIEVKMSTSNSKNGGRVRSTLSYLRSPQDIVDYLNDIYGYDNIRIGGYTTLNTTIKQICDFFDISKEEAFNTLLDGIIYQFKNLRGTDKENYGDNYDIAIYKDNEIKKQIDNLIKDINIKNIDDLGSLLIRIHGCLCLIEYQKEAGWDYLLVGNSENGNYYMIDKNVCTFDNLENLYYDNNFVFKDGPSNTSRGNERNYTSTIYVSTKKDLFKN